MLLTRLVHGENRELLGYMMECPGCESHHAIYTETRNDVGAVWQFDGNMEKPTFNPSILCRWKYGEAQVEKVCHFFVRQGMIEFLSDCTHALAGKTVAMVDMEKGEE